MKDWEFRLTNRLLPQCQKLGNYTEQYIHCHLRHITLPGNSPVGTCRIGAAGDPAAVVDPLLRYSPRLRLQKLAFGFRGSTDFWRILWIFSLLSQGLIHLGGWTPLNAPMDIAAEKCKFDQAYTCMIGTRISSSEWIWCAHQCHVPYVCTVNTRQISRTYTTQLRYRNCVCKHAFYISLSLLKMSSAWKTTPFWNSVDLDSIVGEAKPINLWKNEYSGYGGISS